MRMGRASGEDADSKEADDTLLLDWYKELTTALLTYTRPDGGYSWQVQAVDGHLDTSATGMILYGILNGCGRSDAPCAVEDMSKEHEQELSPAGSSYAQNDMTPGRELFERETSEGKVGNTLSSCDDFGVHYQTYGHYPWGQGAGLAFVSLFMERL
jgi:hypothetical protein